MSADELEEYEDPNDDEPQAAAEAPDDEPPPDEEPGGKSGYWRKEARTARREAHALRDRLKAAQHETLQAVYGSEIVAEIPDWVTTAEQRTEFAAKLAAARGQAPGSPQPRPEPEIPAGLIAIQGAPPVSAGLPNGDADLSAAELGKLAQENPARFQAALAAKYGNG